MQPKDTPITNAALEQLDARKKVLTDYTNQLMTLFTEKVKTAFERSIEEMQNKQMDLYSLGNLTENSLIINPEEPTEEKTGKSENEK